MNDFYNHFNHLLKEFGCSKTMVLSTSLNDKVTSRMMSIIQKDGKFYFQTSNQSRKYKQLKNNRHISLCMDNIQIDGTAEESGHPLDSAIFTELYKRYFPDAFSAYSLLKNEKLFIVTPTHLQRWLYLKGEPYIESFDIKHQKYSMEKIHD